MIRRIGSLTIKEFLHLLHNWWLPALILVGGALELLLIGWATSRPITNLPLMVLDHDQSAASRALIGSLENMETFVLEGYVDRMDRLQQAFDRGEITAALVIPPGHGSQVARLRAGVANPGRVRPTVALWLDGAESMAASAALRDSESAVQQFGQQLVIHHMSLDERALMRFEPSLRVWFNEELSEALYTTPAELGLMLEFTVLIFAALAFARERELGTLEQLLVMPFSSLEIIVGKALPAAVVGFADFWLLLGIIHVAFGVPVRGSVPLLFVLALGYVLVELGKGLVISIVSRTQHQAFLLVMMVVMVDFMFTGFAAPVESMPRVLQWVAQFVPAHHWLAILRGVLLKGAGLDVLWPHVVALAALGLVIGSFSLYYVRKALE